MVDCDICGKKGVSFIIEVEGAKMAACQRCAYHGKILHSLEEKKVPAKTDYSTPRQFRIEEELVDGYGQKIRKARETMKVTEEEIDEYGKKVRKTRPMTIDEVARKANVRASWLDKVENEKIPPTIEEARKLEKVLGIKLVEKVEVSATPSAGKGERESKELTLLDMLEMQKKKRE